MAEISSVRRDGCNRVSNQVEVMEPTQTPVYDAIASQPQVGFDQLDPSSRIKGAGGRVDHYCRESPSYPGYQFAGLTVLASKLRHFPEVSFAGLDMRIRYSVRIIDGFDSDHCACEFGISKALESDLVSQAHSWRCGQ
jgi:hypothetical protein